MVVGSGIAESVVEEAMLEWFRELDYEVRFGPQVEPGQPGAVRENWNEVVLLGRLHAAIRTLNPKARGEALDEALRRVLLTESPSLVRNNRSFHRMLVDGVDVDVSVGEGRVRGEKVWLVDFDHPERNDWLAVNQFTVVEGQVTRRPDVVVFVNGLPLAVIELKNPASQDATVLGAYKQLQTYKSQISSLLAYNEVLVASDGVEARVGSLTAPPEWFLPWRTIEGEDLASPLMPQLQVVTFGIFDKRRFLDLVRSFVVFEQDGETLSKKIAGYHQFHATRKAVEATVEASGPNGDRRAGVVWHTQGSGKSLTMVFYAGKLVRHPALRNPTVVVITDRNDLDDQLFGVFARCHELLRQVPLKVESRAELRDELRRAAGGVIFTTIQKFGPEAQGERIPVLSDRSNVVVIVDEAHRSQYGFIEGFARHMRDALPNATYVGFTGTPIELADRDTRAIFGDYISVYDIQRAVADGATVPIYYESRLAKLDLSERERPRLDQDFEEVTEGEEEARKERLKSKWAALEAIVGTEKRLSLIARDMVEHFEQRLGAMDGKAMVVTMSRRVAVDLYSELVKLRPEWHDDDDERGVVKIVMTGSASDPLAWQPHIRNKARRERLADRFKSPDDPFKVVIVRDMWLTGFDAPSLHTMYVDKPMKGHGLMQAIARVNRVFRDKPGGLVVDYLGLADNLRQALKTYTESGGKGLTAMDMEEAVALMLESFEKCEDLFHGFDYSKFLSGTASERLSVMPAAMEHVLGQDDGKDRLVPAVAKLSRAFALAVPREEALEIRDRVGFFQAVKASLVKTTLTAGQAAEELDHAVRQIVAGAIAPEGVIDIFAAAGLQKPDISLLSESFLAEVRELPQKNLAVELLEKLLSDEIKVKSRKNVVESRRFSEMLEASVRRYQNRAVETAQVIEELIALAKEMQAADRRGEELGLSEDEVAFYDALAANDSAREVLGDESLTLIAREVAATVRGNATIDWTARESARANLRRLVRRILRKHGYPPDKAEAATQTVLEQAQLFGLELVRDTRAPHPVEREEGLAARVPFVPVSLDDHRPYVDCIPLYSLEAAAGSFSATQVVEPAAWVIPNGKTKPGPGLFVAQVVGESMNRRIPNGAYCVFRYPVEGSRTGRVVLVESRDLADPETGGAYTVKIYGESLWTAGEEERHVDVTLTPDSLDPSFGPIHLTDQAESDVRVLAELVEVLPVGRGVER